MSMRIVAAGLSAAALMAAAVPPALAQTGPLPPQAPITQTPLAPPPQYRPPTYSPSSPGGVPAYSPSSPGGAPPSPQPGVPSGQPGTPSPFGQSGAMPPVSQPGPTVPSAQPGATPAQPGTQAGQAQDVPGASTGPAIIPNTWVPQGTAVLQALDKVNAQSATLTVKVGQSAKFGSLSIAVQACDIRPPDQPADAAAFLVVTDSHADAPGFQGWMLKKEPEVNMLEHPIYDLRVTGCTP